jgi:type I restriction enzyme S subunit
LKDFLARVPLGWVKTNLGQITFDKVRQGLTIQDNDFTYIDISSINNELKEITAAKSMPVAKAPSRARQQVERNDVLVSMTRPNLNAVAIVPEDMAGSIASTGFDVLRGILVNPKWIFAHVRSQRFINEMTQRVQGALYPAVKSADVRSYEILLPPLPEQNRLVGKIEALQTRNSKARKALEAIPPLLEKFRQSVLSSAFRGDLTADWRAQNPDIEPAEKLLERIRIERRKRWEEDELAKMKAKGQTPKDDNWKKKYKEPEPVDTTDLPELPEGWCWAPLSHLIIEGPTNGYSPKGGSDAQGTSSLKLSATTSGKLILNEDTIKPLYETIDSKSKHWLQVGDILIQRANSIEYLGATAYFDGPSSKYIYPDLMMRIRTSDEVLGKWLWKYCNSMSCREYFRSKATGTAGNMPKINGKVLKETPVPIGPYHEIEQSIKLLHTLDKKRDSIADFVNKSLSEISFLDQSILAKAFRGELVPQDPNDEPASELLERIKQEKASHEVGKKQRGKAGRKKRIRKQGATAMTKKKERRPLVEVLQPHSSGLSPEVLFSQAGFDEHLVDEFYVELKNEVVSGNIIEDRPDKERVILRLNAA